MTKQIVLILIACFVVHGCAHDNRPTWLSEVESVSAQLTEIYDVWHSELSAREMADKHFHFFAESPTILPANQPAIVGSQAVADFYYGAYQDIDIVSNSYRDLEIVVNGNMATRRWIGTGVFRIADQPDPLTANNRYLDVLIKEDNEWRILLHSWVPVSW